MEFKKIKISCPKCKKTVGYWDGKTETNVLTSCRNCYVGILFIPETLETKRVTMPGRNCSSGMTFV